MSQGFRQRVRRGDRLLGVFIKTPAYQLTELVALAGLDFAVLDAEHAPFNLGAIDAMMLGARSSGSPCLVRPPDAAAAFIGQVLDVGASGVLVPHTLNAVGAERALTASKYARGERGFSPSTRAGGYGALGASAYRAAADQEINVWCQIEDAEALSNLDEIAAIEEVDCLFVGRADLAASLGVDGVNHPSVTAAVIKIAEAGRRAGRPLGIYIADPAEMASFIALGFSVFVCGSDQSYFISEGRRIRAALAGL